MNTPRRSDDRGQTTLLLLVFLGFLVMLVGLVSDGGQTLASRRELQGLADGAARAGASAIDQATFAHAHTAVINPQQADQAAHAYLAAQGFGGQAQVGTSTRQVVVTLAQTYPLSFAGFLGIPNVTLHAMSQSGPFTGS
jgi:uncharacterized membrane protein